MAAKTTKPAKRQRDPAGIQSVEIALDVLQTMVRLRGAASLGDLSRATGLQPSKLHRYLVSLVRTEMVTQSTASGLYDLGPTARQLGVAAFNRFDSYGQAQDRVSELADETGHDALLYIWTEQGATLVRQQSGVHPMPMTLRLGASVPLRQSAVGHVFLAYMPEDATARLLREQNEDGDIEEDEEALRRKLEQIRKDEYFWSPSTVLPSSEVLAVPVFEMQHRFHSVIVLAFMRRVVTPALKESLIKRVRQAAADLSKELGDI